MTRKPPENFIPEPHPWDDPVDGAGLADELSEIIHRFVVMDDRALWTITLWIVGTHLFQAFIIYPRLAITSPEKRCGKTTLLDILAELVCRPLCAANVTAAVVFRFIEKKKITLLIDEIDRFLNERKDLIGVLNAGHRRGAKVLRTVKIKGDHQPYAFDVYTPVALAGIGSLPDTIADRSLHAALRRRLRNDPVEFLRLDKMEQFKVLARKCARWANDIRATIGAADPEMPPELFNRAADNWRPICAIADRLGGEWPQRARQAALSAVRRDGETDESDGVMLLEDLRQIFDETGHDALYTNEIIPTLVEKEHRPWAEWRDDKPISPRGMAKLLVPFGVKSGSLRRGETTGKGYKRADLDDAFARYL